MLKFVDLEALNFRSEPVVTPSTLKGVLNLGQRVDELGPAGEPGWVRIRTEFDGESREGVVKVEISPQPANGFVAKRSLREPVADAREAIVAEAVQQWLRFERGQGLEHHNPFSRFVGEMWQSIGINLDGKDRDTPWSAAAISFMVRRAGTRFGKYNNFRFAAAHSKYMHDSILKRRQNDLSAPYWGFRLHEQRPQIGDLVGRWRETPRDFDDAESQDAFKSHTDVVVSISPDFVLAIGGNIGHSVSISRYPKTPAGFIAAEQATFILMVNRA